MGNTILLNWNSRNNSFSESNTQASKRKHEMRWLRFKQRLPKLQKPII